MGYDYEIEELKEIGMRIYAAKNRYKKDCGVDFESLIPSERIFETSGALGKTDREFFLNARNKMAKKIKETIAKFS